MRLTGIAQTVCAAHQSQSEHVLRYSTISPSLDEFPVLRMRTSSLCSVLHKSVSLTSTKALFKAQQVAEAQNECPSPVHHYSLLVVTPTQLAAPSGAVTGMPFAPTHSASWPGDAGYFAACPVRLVSQGCLCDTGTHP